MKKHIRYIVLALVALTSISCNKQDFDYPEGTVGISKITYYAVFKLTNVNTVNGVNYTLVKKGDAYTEPGVVAEIDGATTPHKSSGDAVDTNVPGVYIQTYSAINKDGYPALARRYVVVYSTDATAQGNDFSGTYLRPLNKEKAVFTKLAPGVYSVANPGGAVNVNLVVVAFNSTDHKLIIPEQAANDLSITSSALESSTAAGTGLSAFNWKIVNAGYGPAVRSFVKSED